MNVKEAKEIKERFWRGDMSDGGIQAGHSAGFLDCLEKLKATGVKEVVAYFVSNNPTDALHFAEWEKKAVDALAKLNALMGEDSPSGDSPLGEE